MTNLVEYAIIYKHDLYAPVAQSVEHLTFNQRVRDSSSRRSTKQKDRLYGGLFVCSYEELDLVSRSERDSQHCGASRSARPRRRSKIPAGANNLVFVDRLYGGLFVCSCEELNLVRAKHEGILPLGVLLYLIALFLPFAYNISSPGKILQAVCATLVGVSPCETLSANQNSRRSTKKDRLLTVFFCFEILTILN